MEKKVLNHPINLFISEAEIKQIVFQMAKDIMAVVKEKDVVFVSVLNGAFIFAADLVRKIDIECKITFIKLASYQGTQSTGSVRELVGLNETFEGKTVIVIEDIVDRGITLEFLVKEMEKRNPDKVYIATLLLKKSVYNKDIPIDFVGKEIPDKFVIGYGLDMDGFGRNLPDIYTMECI